MRAFRHFNLITMNTRWKAFAVIWLSARLKRRTLLLQVFFLRIFLGYLRLKCKIISFEADIQFGQDYHIKQQKSKLNYYSWVRRQQRYLYPNSYRIKNELLMLLVLSSSLFGIKRLQNGNSVKKCLPILWKKINLAQTNLN